MGASLDNIPEGFSTVLDTRKCPDMHLGSVGGVAAGDGRKSLALESGILVLEGQLERLAL